MAGIDDLLKEAQAALEASQKPQAGIEPEPVFETDYGGRFFVDPGTGNLAFRSPGYSTSDPAKVKRLMEGAKPADVMDWTPEVSSGGRLMSAARGALQGITFGLGDEAVARGTSALTGLPYDQALAAERARLEQGREESPVAAYGGEIAGGIGTGLASGGGQILRGIGTGLASGGGQILRGIGTGLASGGGQILRGIGTGKAANVARGMVGGAGLGALYGFGVGEGGAENRVDSAVTGGMVGAATGGAAVPLGAAAARAGAGVKNVAQALVNRDVGQKTQRAVGRAVERSGKAPRDIARAMSQAAREGQPEFGLVDALGRPGQRMLSGITRSTPEISQEVQDYLMARQAGQGERVASQLGKAFDVPTTATKMKSEQIAKRGAEADILYEAARQDAGPVDVRGAIAVINDRIGPMQGSGITGDSIDAKLDQFRRRLSAPRPEMSEIAPGAQSVELSDFSRVQGVRQDVQDAIGAALRGGRKNEARELQKLSVALDQALEQSSEGYKAANRAFAKASRTIDRFDEGAAAAAPRQRAEDTIAQYRGLSVPNPDNLPAAGMTPQSAYRAGYGDRRIAAVESAAQGANVARPLTSMTFQKEAAEMAVDPQLLARQLQRENDMFATGQTVLGGSRTADNLIDMQDANLQDQGIVGALMRGRVMDAVGQAVGQAGLAVINRIRGHSPEVKQSIARVLMQSGEKGASGLGKALSEPGADAREILLQVLRSQKINEATKRRVINQAQAASGVAGGLAAAP